MLAGSDGQLALGGADGLVAGKAKGVAAGRHAGELEAATLAGGAFPARRLAAFARCRGGARRRYRNQDDVDSARWLSAPLAKRPAANNRLRLEHEVDRAGDRRRAGLHAAVAAGLGGEDAGVGAGAGDAQLVVAATVGASLRARPLPAGGKAHPGRREHTTARVLDRAAGKDATRTKVDDQGVDGMSIHQRARPFLAQIHVLDRGLEAGRPHGEEPVRDGLRGEREAAVVVGDGVAIEATCRGERAAGEPEACAGDRAAVREDAPGDGPAREALELEPRREVGCRTRVRAGAGQWEHRQLGDPSHGFRRSRRTESWQRRRAPLGDCDRRPRRSPPAPGLRPASRSRPEPCGLRSPLRPPAARANALPPRGTSAASQAARPPRCSSSAARNRSSPVLSRHRMVPAGCPRRRAISAELRSS